MNRTCWLIRSRIGFFFSLKTALFSSIRFLPSVSMEMISGPNSFTRFTHRVSGMPRSVHSAGSIFSTCVAASTALGRLRDTLGDQLFVRTGRGMLPTPRASQLAEPVTAILDKLRDEVLSASGFVAADSDRTFTLGLSDVGSYVLWPRIVSAVAQQAPSVRLRMQVVTQPLIASAPESAVIDVALGAYPDLTNTLYQRRLFERKYVAMVRIGHPLASKL